MSLVIRQLETGEKKEFPAWSRSAIDTIYKGSLDTMQKMMLKMNYSNTPSEVYAIFPNLVIKGGDYRCISCPRLQVIGLSPAEEGILHAFRSSLIRSFSKHLNETPADISNRQSTRLETDPGVYQFCLKQKWYRVMDTEGNELKVEHNQLESLLTPGKHVSVEIHLGHIRTYMNKDEKECLLLQPIVRKITLQ